MLGVSERSVTRKAREMGLEKDKGFVASLSREPVSYTHLDLYDKLCERCNNEISKLFLGNTLTTEASDKGTQALGTVHKDVEEKVRCV